MNCACKTQVAGDAVPTRRWWHYIEGKFTCKWSRRSSRSRTRWGLARSLGRSSLRRTTPWAARTDGFVIKGLRSRNLGSGAELLELNVHTPPPPGGAVNVLFCGSGARTTRQSPHGHTQLRAHVVAARSPLSYAFATGLRCLYAMCSPLGRLQRLRGWSEITGQGLRVLWL